MLYNVAVVTQDGRGTFPQITAIKAQQIFEAHIQQGVDFMIKVSKHVCKHYWETDRSLTSITFQCVNCDATFDLTDADLNSYLRAAE